MNKVLLLSFIYLILMTFLVGGITYAYFNSTATSKNNTFASGTLDLKLANGEGSLSNSVTATFGGSSLAPGVCLDSSTLTLKNTGSVAGNHIDLSAVNSNNAFAAYLKLKVLTLDGSDIVVADSNANGIRDLQDFATGGIVNKAFTDFAAHSLVMQVCLDSSAGNAQQGQSNTLDLTIFLDQGAHS